MSSRGITLFIWIVWCIGAIAQQSPVYIEDEIPRNLESDAIVTTVVRSLKTLRKRLDAMGSRHPARREIEERVRKEETRLEQRLRELRPEVRMPTPFSPQPMEAVEEQKPKEMDVESAKAADKSEDQAPPRENSKSESVVPEIVEPDEKTETTVIPTEENLFEENAYPWLKSYHFTAVGSFSNTETMWGIEPHCDTDGVIESGTIWEWRDNWREKNPRKFLERSKPILAFHASSRIVSDGVWFVIYGDFSKGNRRDVEVWGCKGWPANDVEVCEQLLFKGVLGYESDTVSMDYDPLRKTLVLGVNGELELTDRCPAVELGKGSTKGVEIGLKQWLDNLDEQTTELITDHILLKEQTVLSRVVDPNSTSRERVLRPFWRKTGAAPSCAPKWWRHRNQRVLWHTYQPDKTPSENGQALWGAISRLEPGDTLKIQPGVYSSQDRLDLKLQGLASAPIVVQGDGPGVVFTRTDSAENVVNVVEASFAAVGGLEITGGSTGIRIQSASDLMIYNCTIHDVGNVGVSLNYRNTADIYIVDNEIYATGGHGEGIYAGSHDGTRSTHDSFFVGNYIHDLASGSESQSDGIEIKNRSYGNTVKWNYIEGSKYPGITVYTAGDETKPVNVIQENVILDSQDSGIQVTADAVVQSNWISGKKTGIASRPFGRTSPRNIRILGNTIVSETFAIKATEWNRSDNVIANNFLYSKTRNYFHSGYGRAIYLSNQLVCDLEEGCDVSKLSQTVTNRLMSSHDIFGYPRTLTGRVGAVESVDLNARDTSGVVAEDTYRSAAFNCKDSLLTLFPYDRAHNPFTIKCVGPRELPHAFISPSIQVIRCPDRIAGSFQGVSYSVSLFDKSSRILYQGVVNPSVSRDKLVLSARFMASDTESSLGASSSGELLIFGTPGIRSLIAPEFE
jgi:hypothetical protein